MMNNTAKTPSGVDNTKPKAGNGDALLSDEVPGRDTVEAPHLTEQECMALLETIDSPQLLFTPVDTPFMKAPLDSTSPKTDQNQHGSLADQVASMGLASSPFCMSNAAGTDRNLENAMPSKAVSQPPYRKSPFQSPRATKKKCAFGDSTNATPSI